MKAIIPFKLSPAQKKQLDEYIEMESKKEIDRYFDMRALDYDRSMLLYLHNEYGFGIKRLREFYFNYSEKVGKLLRDYNEFAFEKIDKELKKIGVDVKEWDKEING